MWMNRIIKNDLYYSGKFKTTFKDVEYEFDVNPLIDELKWKSVYDEYSKKIEEDIILFNDADVFWLKDPFPLLNFQNINVNRYKLYFNHSMVW